MSLEVNLKLFNSDAFFSLECLLWNCHIVKLDIFGLVRRLFLFLLASGPQRRPLLLQMHSVQQQGELPGGDAPDGNFHPREVSCSHTRGENL